MGDVSSTEAACYQANVSLYLVTNFAGCSWHVWWGARWQWYEAVGPQQRGRFVPSHGLPHSNIGCKSGVISTGSFTVSRGEALSASSCLADLKPTSPLEPTAVPEHLTERACVEFWRRLPRDHTEHFRQDERWLIKHPRAKTMVVKRPELSGNSNCMAQKLLDVHQPSSQAHWQSNQSS